MSGGNQNSSLLTAGVSPTVLVVNDDGPPSDESPWLWGFVQALRQSLGWTVRVLIPSSQCSWIGKAFHINKTLHATYFYPEGPNGRRGERMVSSRADGKTEEWVLLDGTPASCCSIGIHNLYKHEIDLVLSGPNYGRNTSTAFVLSSGTVGAAMVGALSGIPSIALSYAIFQRPIDDDIIQQAHSCAVRIVSLLWRSGFTDSSNSLALYNVNIPLLPGLSMESPIRFTTLAEYSYGRLFTSAKETKQSGEGLAFKFQPDIGALISPDPESMVDGTDVHAVMKCRISVTPLRAAFANADVPASLQEHATDHWKL